MRASIICVLLLALSTTYAEESHRPKTHEDKLADAEHYDDEGEHNPEHDHEAFLGDEKEEFDNLSPEEARKRLRILLKKVDSDKDGAITTEELTDWVKKVFKERSLHGVEKDMEDKDSDHNGLMSWNEYIKGTYGDTGDDDEEVKELLQRDKRRFDAADGNKDGSLSKEEFATFLHPESSPEMGDVHIQETIEDIDRDKDGFVSLKEFLGEYTEEEGAETPEWVTEETKRFNEEYDKNKDGKLDKDEVKEWILPETDHIMAAEEARHLVTSADDDGDGKLNAEEIDKHYAVFVGSEATDYGRALPQHEEL